MRLPSFGADTSTSQRRSPKNRHPSQMPKFRYHYSHVEDKFVGTSLREKLTLEEHGRPFEKLGNRTITFEAESKMLNGSARFWINFIGLT